MEFLADFIQNNTIGEISNHHSQYPHPQRLFSSRSGTCECNKYCLKSSPEIQTKHINKTSWSHFPDRPSNLPMITWLGGWYEYECVVLRSAAGPVNYQHTVHGEWCEGSTVVGGGTILSATWAHNSRRSYGKTPAGTIQSRGTAITGVDFKNRPLVSISSPGNNPVLCLSKGRRAPRNSKHSFSFDGTKSNKDLTRC